MAKHISVRKKHAIAEKNRAQTRDTSKRQRPNTRSSARGCVETKGGATGPRPRTSGSTSSWRSGRPLTSDGPEDLHIPRGPGRKEQMHTGNATHDPGCKGEMHIGDAGAKKNNGASRNHGDTPPGGEGAEKKSGAKRSPPHASDSPTFMGQAHNKRLAHTVYPLASDGPEDLHVPHDPGCKEQTRSPPRACGPPMLKRPAHENKSRAERSSPHKDGHMVCRLTTAGFEDVPVKEDLAYDTEVEGFISTISKKLANGDQLLPHQLQGIEKMLKLRGRALLADDMGLGKTAQSLFAMKFYEREWPLLVICPPNAMGVWEDGAVSWLSLKKDQIMTNKKIKVPREELFERLYTNKEVKMYIFSHAWISNESPRFLRVS